jgi:uncharacterized RDD family membrane protein YckC
VTKTCSQCGAILPSSVHACSFCDSSLIASSDWSASGIHPQGSNHVSAWRGELAQRMEAYRARRKRTPANENQARFTFEAAPSPPEAPIALQQVPSPEEEFSFTVAIGRMANKRDDDPRMVIDVSLPLGSTESTSGEVAVPVHQPGLYPVASVDDRRLAALADGACLLFAYGAFLALFSAVGGQFTLSKLSAAVCAATFAIVYLQYFALFTVFGGTTPGMMLRGLEVVSFSGDTPKPRQMLLRSAGYLLSAGTFFLGFLWAVWDEDSLTWHDRISHTYLTSVETYADVELPHPSHSR